jgi:hypothetical protein
MPYDDSEATYIGSDPEVLHHVISNACGERSYITDAKWNGTKLTVKVSNTPHGSKDGTKYKLKE